MDFSDVFFVPHLKLRYFVKIYKVLKKRNIYQARGTVFTNELFIDCLLFPGIMILALYTNSAK